MPRSDTPRSDTPRLPRARDPRLDAFRGAALVMIFIDHVPGNPYERFTLRNWGFSDAAEAFFVISGVAVGLAYAGRFSGEERAERGLWPAVQPVWRRAWTLYQAQILLTFWAIAIFAGGSILFGLPELLTTINLRQVFQNTEAALLGIPLLTHQLGYVNILPAYAVLMLAAPGAILIGLWSPRLLLALSLSLWLAAGIWYLNLPNYPNPGGWFFNPLSWQLIFMVGLATGLAMRKGERLVPRHPALIALAAGFLVFVLAWRYLPGLGEVLNHQMARAQRLGAPPLFTAHDKTYVSLPRLLHILALVYLLASLASVRTLCGQAWAAPLRLMGRHGLLVFAAGTVLSLLFQVLMAGYDQPAWMAWLLPPLGIALSIAIAALAERQKAQKRRPAPVAASVPAPVAVPFPAPASASVSAPLSAWTPRAHPAE